MRTCSFPQPARLGLKSWLNVICLCLLPHYSVWATAEEILAGHEGWLDRMGGGVHELGRGNTGTTLENASPAAYWNPALLGMQRKTQIGLGSELRSLNRNGGFASIQGRAAANLGLGLGVINRGDWQVTAYDKDERPIGTAHPQAFGSWLGLGLRTSRVNAVGLAVGAYYQNLDLDGVGDVNVIGFLNLAWYRRFGEHWRSALVVRNLGLGPHLNANFDQVTLGDETASGFERSSSDFWPKTLIVAGSYQDSLRGRPFEVSVEVIDYQLKPSLYSLDANFHSQALRLGGEWEAWPGLQVRAGLDRLNPTAGLGYVFKWGRHKPIFFDYAITLERGLMTVNPFAVGFRYEI